MQGSFSALCLAELRRDGANERKRSQSVASSIKWPSATGWSFSGAEQLVTNFVVWFERVKLSHESVRHSGGFLRGHEPFGPWLKGGLWNTYYGEIGAGNLAHVPVAER